MSDLRSSSFSRLRWSCALVLASASALLASCELLDGGGGGGGEGNIAFTRGFAFVRNDDRNLAVADEGDLETSALLTSAGGVYTPSLSRDGRRVVFALRRGATSELQVVPSTGGTPSTLLVASDAVKNVRTPVFSPDGSLVAFAFDDPTGSSCIGLVNADGSGFVKLAGGTTFAYASPSFYPDGQHVLAAAGGAGLPLRQLEKVNVRSGQAVSVASSLQEAAPSGEALAIVNRVVLSPDGDLAAFDASPSGGGTRVFVLDLAAGRIRRVNDYTSDAEANDTFPAWQSASVVVYSSDSGGNDNVYRVSSDGTGRKLLLPRAIEPSYAPL